MKATKEELDRFHEFACQQVAKRDRDVSMYDLVTHWMELQERERNNAIIRQGIKDIEAGRGRDIDEFMDAISHEFDVEDS
jgi:predicted transcriptional regulator